METQLPESVRLSVTATLARHGEWAGSTAGQAQPVIVRTLGDGSNNFSLLVANDRQFVLRADRAPGADNALEPGAEYAALQRAADAGLAPALRFADAELGTIVCDYLPPDAQPDHTPGALAALLRNIHALEPVPHTLSLEQRIRHYQSRLAQDPGMNPPAGALRDADAAVEAARTLEALGHRPVLCHNDLLPPNCLQSGGKLWAIDWEYAAMGDRWFDLAVTCQGHGFGPDDRQALVETYLGRPATGDERESLQLARTIYRHLERLWYACNLADGGD